MGRRSNSPQVRSSDSNNLILIFVDGIGIGENNPDFNPCCYSKTGIFLSGKRKIPFQGKRFELDACLGIPGLPQSATGHTTIYTGLNAPAYINRHLYGFPNQELRQLIHRYSLFVILAKQGYRCKFMNAFRPIFFTTPEIFINLHMSATTEMNRSAGLGFSDFSQLKKRKALYHDYTNKEIKDKGFKVPRFSARDAAKILISAGQSHNFVLYEYFLTDFAGHAQNMKQAVAQIHRVENLIIEVLSGLDLDKTTLIVISDHGNIEDMRVKSHTTNPAFMAIWSGDHILNTFSFNSLQDLFPFIFFKLTGQFYDLPDILPKGG